MKQDDEWGYIRVPRKFKERIEVFIREHPELGWRSVAQFMIDASRSRIEEYERIYNGSKGEAVADA